MYRYVPAQFQTLLNVIYSTTTMSHDQNKVPISIYTVYTFSSSVIMYCAGCTTNISQSFQLFNSVDTAYAYFTAHQVFPTSVQCTFCEKPARLYINQSKWRCQQVKIINGIKTRCNFTRSLTADTWLKGTHLPLDVIGKFIVYYLLLPPPHQPIIMSELKLAEKTIVRWTQVIREAQLQWCLSNTPQMLGGPNTVVEVDEALFGHRKYHRGRVLSSQWVFGGIQRGTRSFLRPYPTVQQLHLWR